MLSHKKGCSHCIEKSAKTGIKIRTDTCFWCLENRVTWRMETLDLINALPGSSHRKLLIRLHGRHMGLIIRSMPNTSV